jgi:PAS domain S-box-containing protein
VLIRGLIAPKTRFPARDDGRRLDLPREICVPDSLLDLGGLTVTTQDFLAAVVATAAQPIWVVDPDDVIRFANPAAIAALGYDDANELSGRRSHETIHYKHPDGSPYPAAECQMLLPRATGEAVSSDLDWFCRRDGSMFPVSYVSVPVEMAEGRGAVVAFTDIEDRLRAERVLREHDAALSRREDALRRIAALVAGGAASADVVVAIAREVGHVVGVRLVTLLRYEPDGASATVIGAWGEHPNPFQVGTRWPLDGPSVTAQVLKTSRPAKIEDFSNLTGSIAEAAVRSGIRARAGAPIIVDGKVWGVMLADAAGAESLRDDIEDRLAEFTELVATAISNTTSREQITLLAEEQAALRRVATLVARESPPAETFAVVAEEVARLLGVEDTTIFRYEDDWTATVVADRAGDREVPLAIGSRMSLEGESATALVRRTGRPARVDDFSTATGPLADYTRDAGIGSSVASPIVVNGRLWGAVVAATRDEEPMPPTTEARIGQFTELVATAIANVEARAEVERLADEQAALRRVATLVARASSPVEVFGAVTQEAARVVATEAVGMLRFDPDGAATLVAQSHTPWEPPPLGTQFPLDGDSALAVVHRTGRAAREEYKVTDTGSVAAAARSLGIRFSVATPIVVEGRLWGTMVAATSQSEPPPPDTESRLSEFTDLVATAISNAEVRTELDASRTRLVTAADDARRRVVRDLHDGAQQRLVHSIINLKLAKRALRRKEAEAESLVDEALAEAERGNAELRELAHGILPPVLIRGGLWAAVDTVVARLDLPVQVDVTAERFAAEVEASAYFIVAEALTNVVKHAQAERAEVRAFVEDRSLHVEVRDDGVGGADSEGHGLVGLADRATALGGHLTVECPATGGTLVAAVLPLSERLGNAYR